MEPNKSQWNVVHLSEYRNRKSSPFGPISSGKVKKKESPAFRQAADEAIALGNSHRVP